MFNPDRRQALRTRGKAHRHTRVIAALAVPALLFAACGSDEDTQSPEASSDVTVTPEVTVESTETADSTALSVDEGADPVVIGAVLPLTGTFSEVGTAAEAGLRATAEIINEDGGILGREVQIEVRDSAGETQQAVGAMRDLLEIDNLVGAVPEVFSHLTPAVAPLVEEAGVLSFTVSDMTTVAPVASDFPLLYGTNRPNVQAVTAQLALARDHGIKTIGVLTPENAVALQTFENAQELAPDFGIEVVAAETFALDSTDVTPQLTQIQAADPDALIVWGTAQPLGVIARSIRDVGMTDVEVIVADESLHKDLAVTIPEEIQKQFSIVLPRSGATQMGNAAAQRFLATLNEMGGLSGNMSSAQILHDGLQTLRYGFETAGSFDTISAADAINGLSTASDLPEWWAQYNGGPKFSSDVHGSANATFDVGFWAVAVAPFSNNEGIFDAQEFDFALP